MTARRAERWRHRRPEVRAWAIANGYDVKATGRLPEVVVVAWEQAQARVA